MSELIVMQGDMEVGRGYGLAGWLLVSLTERGKADPVDAYAASAQLVRSANQERVIASYFSRCRTDALAWLRMPRVGAALAVELVDETVGIGTRVQYSRPSHIQPAMMTRDARPAVRAQADGCELVVSAGDQDRTVGCRTFRCVVGECMASNRASKT